MSSRCHHDDELGWCVGNRWGDTEVTLKYIFWWFSSVGNSWGGRRRSVNRGESYPSEVSGNFQCCTDHRWKQWPCWGWFSLKHPQNTTSALNSTPNSTPPHPTLPISSYPICFECWVIDYQGALPEAMGPGGWFKFQFVRSWNGKRSLCWNSLFCQHFSSQEIFSLRNCPSVLNLCLKSGETGGGEK